MANWALRDINHREHHLSDYSGKAGVLDCRAIWCYACLAVGLHVQASQKRAGDDGVVVIGLRYNEYGGPATAMKKHSHTCTSMKQGLKESLLRLAVVTSLLVFPGCGGFLVEDGIFPLPTIHIISPTPAVKGLSYETVTTESANGETIYGWFIPAEGAAATILFDHGALFNRSTYVDHIELFHDLGCHILIMDYQGFGESLALARLDTVLADANAALDYLRSRPEPGTDQIVIYGISMGTLPALAQAAAGSADVVGVMVEGIVQQKRLSNVGYILLGIAPSPEAFSRLPPSLDPFSHVTKITIPKLFIQSLDDTITPFTGAKDLFEMAAKPKTLAKSTGFHGLSISSDPAYAGHVRAFLDEVVQR